MSDDPYKELSRRVLSKIFWLETTEKLAVSLPDVEQAITGLPPSEQDVVRTFQANIRSVVVTASVPYRLVYSGVYRRRFQASETAARIRRLQPDNEDLNDEDYRAAAQSAKEQLEALLATREGELSFIQEMVLDLNAHLNSSDFALAAEELLR